MCDEPWVPNASGGAWRPISCGRCRGCRLEYSRQWAVRCMHEASLHDRNCFVTLTYADAPVDLQYRDFQLFMKRLRKRDKCSFYMCGEYGELNGRPHFHGLLFGIDFPDKVYFGRSPAGFKLYTSASLSVLWPHGFSSVGEVTFESCGYVARYVHKKMGQANGGAYSGSVGEFSRMSLRPAIGKKWFDKFGASDVVPDGHVVVDGHKAIAPRYYRREMKKRFPLSYLRQQMMAEALARKAILDSANPRIAAKVAVREAAMSSVVSKL